MSDYAGFWKKFWSLNMPGKVLNFLWRVCKACLPTAVALVSKRVDISAICPWCHGGLESDTHVLFEFDFAKTVWQTTGIYSLLHVAADNKAFDVIRRFFDGCSREQCVLLGMVCWGIWNRRNKWVWDKANGSVFRVKSAALNLLQDWREAQVVGMQTGGVLSNAADRQWSKPLTGWYKVNIDPSGARNGEDWNWLCHPK